jgi:histidinol-phosphate aminotransferase
MTKYERDNIQAMQGYIWGEQPDNGQTIKLNTNENPYPPSPKVDEVLSQATGASLRQYPNPLADPLRDSIALQHQLTRDHIVMTHGGDEALRLAITTFVEPKGVFGMAEPSYSLYPVLAAVQDATVARVQLEQDWELPLDTVTQLNQQGAALTCLVNPHAPSGTLMQMSALTAFADELDGVLLIDEAYVDFVDPQSAYDSKSLVKQFPNVLILRTFSKGYGLAGLRLGYLMGDPSLIQPIIGKTRDSDNIDHISQQIGNAAFGDQEYASETWRRVRDERVRVERALGQLGFVCPPSQANFLLASVAPTSSHSAKGIYLALKERGILVRYFETDRLADKLRISVGTPEENNMLIEHMTELLV